MSAAESLFCRSAPWRFLTSRVVFPWAIQGVSLKGHALEIGGGSGAMAAALLRGNPGLRMTVTDYDDAMVSAARRRLSPFGERVTTQQADATALPFPDASFDAVASFIMLHNTMRWEEALGEAARVLRPGGRLVGYDLLASPPMRLLHQAERAAHRMMRLDELRQVLGSLP